MPDPHADRAAYYSKHQRDPAAKAFYNSVAWSGPNGARTQYIRAHPICERCQKVVADHVHHKIPLAQCTPEQRLDPANCMSVCLPCHLTLEAAIRRNAEPPPLPTGKLIIIEPPKQCPTGDKESSGR